MLQGNSKQNAKFYCLFWGYQLRWLVLLLINLQWETYKETTTAVCFWSSHQRLYSSSDGHDTDWRSKVEMKWKKPGKCLRGSKCINKQWSEQCSNPTRQNDGGYMYFSFWNQCTMHPYFNTNTEKRQNFFFFFVNLSQQNRSTSQPSLLCKFFLSPFRFILSLNSFLTKENLIIQKPMNIHYISTSWADCSQHETVTGALFRANVRVHMCFSPRQ